MVGRPALRGMSMSLLIASATVLQVTSSASAIRTSQPHVRIGHTRRTQSFSVARAVGVDTGDESGISPGPPFRAPEADRP